MTEKRNMNQFCIFDSTLSEGGQIINWQFGLENIVGVISGLFACGTEFVDIGVLCNEKSSEDRTVICGGRQLYKILSAVQGGSFSATAIIERKPLPPNNYIRYIPESVDFSVRVKFDRWNIDKALCYCEDLKRWNVSVSIDPVNCLQYSLEEFRTMVKRFRHFNPKIFFISDDYGICEDSDICSYFDIVRELLSNTVLIAYRGRGATKKVIKSLLSQESPVEKPLLIESSVIGLGTKFANARSEEIADFLNRYEHANYQLKEYAALTDNYLKEPFASVGVLTITDIFREDSRSGRKYEQYYHKLGVGNQEILACLERVKGKAFSVEYAERILFELRKNYWKRKLGIIVPTCNRPETIRFWLEYSGKRLFQYGIDLIIYDSSSDNKTKNICDTYFNDGFRNIKYVPYKGYYDGKSLDQKLNEAYRQYADRYEYIWIIRDGIAIAWDFFHDQLKKRIDQRDELIVVDSDWRDIWHCGNRKYTRPEKLFEDQCIRMVTLGTMIVKSSFIMEVIRRIPIDDSNYSLWQLIAVFQYYAHHPVHASSYTGNVFVYNPSGTISSFWNSNGKALWQWAERWYEVIHSLPEKYEQKKEKAYKIDMYDFHPFSIHTLMLIKSNNGLRIKDVTYYKKYLKHVHDRPIWQYYALAALPIPHRFLKNAIMHPESFSYRVMRGAFSRLRYIYQFIKREKEAEQ